MPYRFLAFVSVMVLVHSGLFAQEREKITDKSGKSPRIEEVYYVIKGDRTVKDGPYQLFRNDKLLISGYYDHGNKDSVWEAYNLNGAPLSHKSYEKGQRIGRWDFNNARGEAEWSYDFATKKESIQTLSSPFSGSSASYYLSDSGAWVNGPLDKPLRGLSGSGEWLSFLTRTLRYPEDAVDKGQMGEVLIGVNVDEQGTVISYEVIKTAAPSLDAEALRLVKLYPFEFVPAEKDGRKIKAQFRVPIRYRLEIAK